MSALEIVKREPDEAIVAEIRDMLTRAEAGEVVAIAIAVSLRGADTGSVYVFGEDASRHQLLGAVTWLQHRLLHEGDAL